MLCSNQLSYIATLLPERSGNACCIAPFKWRVLCQHSFACQTFFSDIFQRVTNLQETPGRGPALLQSGIAVAIVEMALSRALSASEGFVLGRLMCAQAVRAGRCQMRGKASIPCMPLWRIKAQVIKKPCRFRQGFLLALLSGRDQMIPCSCRSAIRESRLS